LAVGTDKGGLVFFNRKSQRKIPCISKHGKKVIDGDWSNEGLLITCSFDKMLTVSNHQGDTPFDTFFLKGELSNVRWSPVQLEKEKTMCCIVGGAKLFKYDPSTQAHCFIEFDKTYGKIIHFEWYDQDRLFCTF